MMRKEGKRPDPLAFVWPLGTGKSKTRTCQRNLKWKRVGTHTGPMWPPGPLPPGSPCLKVTFLSFFSSKLPSTLTSVREVRTQSLAVWDGVHPRYLDLLEHALVVRRGVGRAGAGGGAKHPFLGKIPLRASCKLHLQGLD